MTMRLVNTTHSANNPLYKLCIVLLLITFLPPHSVRADIGPKPTAAFTFTWETEDQPTIVEGQLLQCEDAGCIDSTPLEALGPQHFTCSATACDSMSYGYTPYAKLVLIFSDGVTRESNIFEKPAFKSQYTVVVRSSDLMVNEAQRLNLPFQNLDPISAFLSWLGILFGLGILAVLLLLGILLILKTRREPLLFVRAKGTCISVWVITLPAFILGVIFAPTLPLTIAIEGILISLFTLIRKQQWFPWVTVVTLGNLFTQVLMLTAITLMGTYGTHLLFTVVGEIFIWLLEAVLIHLTLRRQESVLPSLGISLVLNAVSLGIGLLLPI